MYLFTKLSKMKKQFKDFEHLEIKRPETIKGGDGGAVTTIIIIDETANKS